LFHDSLIARTSCSLSGFDKSMPLISAPHAGDNGVTWISIVSCKNFSREGFAKG
jgi:hypothetical protein